MPSVVLVDPTRIVAFLYSWPDTLCVLPLAKYFLFHTSSNWGVSRQKLHLEELLRLPLPLPEALPDRRRSRAIVNEVNQLVTSAATKAREDFADREELLAANDSIEPLINEYFDILPLEKALIDDTVRVVIHSVRPSRNRLTVPTIEPSTDKQRNAYTEQLCNILSGWAKKEWAVHSSGPYDNFRQTWNWGCNPAESPRWKSRK